MRIQVLYLVQQLRLAVAVRDVAQHHRSLRVRRRRREEPQIHALWNERCMVRPERDLRIIRPARLPRVSLLRLPPGFPSTGRPL